jgi:hypothetical protein
LTFPGHGRQRGHYEDFNSSSRPTTGVANCAACPSPPTNDNLEAGHIAPSAGPPIDTLGPQLEPPNNRIRHWDSPEVDDDMRHYVAGITMTNTEPAHGQVDAGGITGGVTGAIEDRGVP